MVPLPYLILLRISLNLWPLFLWKYRDSGLAEGKRDILVDMFYFKMEFSFMALVSFLDMYPFSKIQF